MIAVRPRENCWIDLFESPDFRGRTRRLFGPGRYLGILKIAGGATMQSIAAGDGAWVFCHSASGDEDQGFWILPGGVVAGLCDTELGAKMDSLIIFDHKPEASDPGYAAYERTIWPT